MDALFGELPLPAKFLIAFIVVLALIGAVAYIVRRFGASGLGAAGTRNRQPRLAVIEAAAVDTRRRLILIRRDNVEHLVLIGGPADVVVETNINRAARDATRPATAPVAEPAVARPPAEEPLRPVMEPRLRPSSLEPIQPDESPLIPPAEPARMHSGERIPGLEMPRPAPRSEPPFAPPPRPVQEPKRPAPPKEISAEEQNLAAMAQRLEAALRRPPAAPGGAEPRPQQRPTIDAIIPQPRQPMAETRVEPRVEVRMTEPPPAEEPHPPKSEPEVAHEREAHETQGEPKAGGQNVFESLEQEMASLLGRPTGKS